MVPGMVPKRFFAAAERPIMPWDLSLQKSMTASAPSSQAVYWNVFATRASGKTASAWLQSRFSTAPASSARDSPAAR